ncbi:histone deacetylase [Streptomyces sp. B15]|uniref:histone deacetylase n=1 Tax=Streptomyces sp. B15 TaxID=1537797 RepID=UPI001B378484|nr:histone deacetylase [Streptomyces sp. B15]MBQ1124628.1 histone deacetylase [Streptomyces sp. B15]
MRHEKAGAEGRPEKVWYAAYGSNVHRERLRAYIRGGRPQGAGRWYPGCRDRGMPVESMPVELPGAVYFATTSPVWGGGRAFYDPEAEGRTLAVAHLVTPGQFSDVAAQEMYREPGTDLDLTQVLAHGRASLGEGRYETLVCAGELAGHPVLTFTAPWGLGEVPYVAPAEAYLRCLASGLLEAGDWTAETVARYLAWAPGAEGVWSAEAVAELVAG